MVTRINEKTSQKEWEKNYETVTFSSCFIMQLSTPLINFTTLWQNTMTGKKSTNNTQINTYSTATYRKKHSSFPFEGYVQYYHISFSAFMLLVKQFRNGRWLQKTRCNNPQWLSDLSLRDLYLLELSYD